MAIAHDVVSKKHGGTLTVESVVGEGTTFIIQLPLGQDGEGNGGAGFSDGD
ncbi:MAG: hypothetical protein AB7E77_08325 [Desulfobulbus sp.]